MRLRTVLSVLSLSLLAAALALADPPKIDGEQRVDPYKLVRLSVKGAEADDAVLWKVRPLEASNEGKVDAAGDGLSGSKIEWTAPPGRYRVELIVGRLKGGKLSLLSDEQVVTVGKAADPMPPDPTDPTDPPATGKLYAVIVREAGTSITPVVRAAMTLPAWQEAYKDGHRMKAIPVDKLPTGFTRPDKVPSVVVVLMVGENQSQLVKTAALPTSDADVRALFK